MIEFSILMNNVGGDLEVHVRLSTLFIQREWLCHDPVDLGVLCQPYTDKALQSKFCIFASKVYFGGLCLFVCFKSREYTTDTWNCGRACGKKSKVENLCDMYPAVYFTHLLFLPVSPPNQNFYKGIYVGGWVGAWVHEWVLWWERILHTVKAFAI